jgi:DNA-binding transcriptional LysR family regulator
VRIGYAYEAEPGLRFRGERTRVAPPIRHRANNGHMLCALAREGLGVALIPTFLAADDLRAGRLEALLVDRLDAEIGIHAVYPHRRHLSSKVRRLVDLLADHCGARPYWDEGLWEEEPPG